MFNKVSEKSMHLFRWGLTSCWLIFIVSLFYDPFSTWLTSPETTWSPFRIDPNLCFKIQNSCVYQHSYSIGMSFFWGIAIPMTIFILLLFGHELWRRICPLSFLSQIPRALKLQRKQKQVNTKNNKISYKPIKIKPKSWLGKYYLRVQFGLLYLGLCCRLLSINNNPLALGGFLLITIFLSMIVVYWYGGKSWCQYFCPMAPVQNIFTEPSGLLTSKAHVDNSLITQSMCRSTNINNQEESTCVACKTACIDIDSERSYWDGIKSRDRKIISYSYLGLVLGYFSYHYLYAGNWSYYFSGIWLYQEKDINSILDPGLYIFGNAINIPRILAVPLTLGLFCWLFVSLGLVLERIYQKKLTGKHTNIGKEQIQHQIFTIFAFISFNVLFVFAGRPIILGTPNSFQYIYNCSIVLISTLWLTKNWSKDPKLYMRESLASRFRKQLYKMQIDLTASLEGRSLDELHPNEVYILAKVLPEFDQAKRYQAYKSIVQEILEEGYLEPASALKILEQMRAELSISEVEYRAILTVLGCNDPELVDPQPSKFESKSNKLIAYRTMLKKAIALQQEKDPKNLRVTKV